MPLNPDKKTNCNGVTVYEYLLTKHNPNHIDMPTANLPAKPLGITIHNTDWINVASNTTPAEQYSRATVNGNMKDVRVHYYVDNTCAWQTLPLTLSGFHAADGSGNGNRKTIAIECIMRNSSDSVSAKSEDNCARLAAWLLHKYGLNVEDNLFTHTHWLNVRDGVKGNNDYLNTRRHPYKWCPCYILPHWTNFKAKVQSYLNQLNGGKAPSTPSTTPSSSKTLYRVRKTWADSKSQIGAYSDLDNAKKACKVGYSVFDESGKVVYSPSGTSTSAATSNSSIPTITYRAYASKWYPEVVNDTDYAGVENKSISGFAAKVSKGTIKYRVHTYSGKWLGWMTAYNINDWNNGCAGIKNRAIDAIQMKLEGVPGYEVQYRVSYLGTSNYLPWVKGTADYAGVFNKTIDKIQAKIVKV